MKWALAQINTTIGDFAGNCQRIAAAAADAAAKGCQVVVFPELAVPGYPPLDLLDDPGFLAAQENALSSLAPSFRSIAGIVGCVGPSGQTSSGPRLQNQAAVFSDGKLQTRHAKTLLPTYDVFDESRYFAPAPTLNLATIAGTKIGITICEDIWNLETAAGPHRYDRDPAAEAVSMGAQILCNLSASPFHLGKTELREQVVCEVARRHQRPIAYVNLVGGNDPLIFDGESLFVDATGRVLARGPGFSEGLTLVDFGASAPAVSRAAEEPAILARKALVLGLRDYVRKCGFTKVVLGLSGGIDSALVACIAAEALGQENVWGVAMPSRYSSPESLEDARALAKSLGIRFDTLPIEPAHRAMRSVLEPLLAKETVTLADENLQARLRGTLLMTLSNQFGHLLLTTGNKSEMAVGYCTLYGDMNGGLAVIGDVWKTLVYEISRTYRAAAGTLIPERVFTKPPSAELRPDQKDSDSLPDYAELDPMLKAYIEDHQSPAEIAKSLRLSPEIVHRIVRMVDLSEYKRRQAAPTLRITAKAFGSGRRLPIAQRYRHA